MSPKSNLLGMSKPKLEEFFVEHGERAFRATQLIKWIHQQGVIDFDAMTNLSKSLRTFLTEQAEIKAPRMKAEQHSADGTRKWVLQLEDGNAIETVFIPERQRGTLCVSSQVGCALDCTFCSTARQGFNRNLTAAEIIAQLWFAKHSLSHGDHSMVTNVVFMGMGEPLLNFNNVVEATRLMLDDDAYGLGKRKVTLSTSGVVPAMDRLRTEVDMALAVSLHAAEDKIRDKLVPINKKYPIKQLLDACQRFVADKHRKFSVTFEYVMLKDVNDAPEQAHKLAGLLRGIPSKINLIPFNPFPYARYERSDPEVIDRFCAILQRAGLTTITRRTRGDDIDAACGQLVGRVQDRSDRRARFERLGYNPTA